MANMNQRADQPRIFLSYTKKDIREVSGLYQKLIDNGFSPWMDTEDILPGEEWKPKIMKAIREATVFIACMSTNSVSKRGVLQEEIREALSTWEQKLPEDIYLIPVRFEECEVPQALSRFQWVDLFEEKGFNKLLAALSISIERAGFTSKSVAEKARQNAMRHAMVAIMSRNMSHNIGSHIISRLGNIEIEEIPRKKYAAFNSFLRTRLEFFAAFSTPHLSAFSQLRLYRDIMAQFMPQSEDRDIVDWQEIIVDNISKAEGFSSRNIEVNYIIDGSRLSPNIINLDPVVICPEGYLGCHAFYIILENIIRNSTKHGSSRRLGRRLEITFSVNTSSLYEDLVEVLIYDNLESVRTNNLDETCIGTQLLEGINATIRQPLLGEHGSLRLGGLGITEMRICASFLRGIYPENPKEDPMPPVLEAMNVDNNLAFKFYLRKGHDKVHDRLRV